MILRIRQAECALADGRLDEAYDLACRDDVRQHRRGQKLVGRLVSRLVERGTKHLDAERFTQALADCDRASRLGGNQPAIGELRATVAAEMSVKQRRRRRHNRLMAEAGRHIDRGRLSVCENLLNGIADMDDDAEAMLNDVARRRTEAEAALTGARQALDRGDFEAVINALLDARQARLTSPQLAELNTDLTRAIVDRVRSEIDRGRLDLAEALLDRYALLCNESLEVAEFDRMLDLCHTARLRIERGQMHEACEAIEQLGRIAPDPAWVRQAMDLVRKAVSSRDAICAGPLGLLAPGPATRSGQMADDDSESDPPPRPMTFAAPRAAVNAGRASALPHRFLLQVDGVGCFLVVRSADGSVGSVSSSRLCDVGLLAQANLPVAMIERLDDDYFLRSDGAVRVNGQAASSRLLSHGDKIELSTRCAMKYCLPNAASTSALLDLTSARLPRADVRKVLLLDSSIIVGPGRATHVRVDDLASPVVLHLRDGQLHYHGELTASDGQRAPGKSEALAMDEPIQIGPLSMRITKV